MFQFICNLESFSLRVSVYLCSLDSLTSFSLWVSVYRVYSITVSKVDVALKEPDDESSIDESSISITFKGGQAS